MDFAPFSNAVPNLLANSLKFTTVELFLLIGSGLLAVGLLTLALTRWGQAKPIWKCVVLSVMAHILLMAYAYSTQLIWKVPTQATSLTDDPMKITLLSEAGGPLGTDQGTAADPGQTQEQPWMKFASFQKHLPAVDELDRPLVDSELEVTIAGAQELTAPKLTPADMASPSIPQLPDPFIDQAGKSEFQTEFQTEFEPLKPSTPVVESLVQPQEIKRPEVAPPIDTLPPIDLPFEQPQVNVQPQQIPSVAPNPFQSTADESNPAFTAELKTKDSEFAPAAVRPSRTSPTNAASSAASRGKLIVTRNPLRLGDGKAVPKMYSLRNRDNRSSVLQKRGGSKQTEQAVASALAWLASSQSKDGRWDPDQTEGGRETNVLGHNRQGAGAKADSGITSLAVLSFLASGHSHLEGPYRETVQRGLEYLISKQQSNGCLSGEATLFAKMYCHSMSLLALSEALALTGDSRLATAVQRGVDYTVTAQNRNDGSWRYQPGDPGDMSQFGWQVLALHSAELGGIHVPRRTKDLMKKFLDRSTSGASKGLASYRAGEGPNATMTAEALVCRYFLDGQVSNTTTEEAAAYVSRELPTNQHMNFYYWYYGTMAMYHAGGDSWKNWNQRLQKTLLSAQETQGANAGSWRPDGIWSSYGGRVYSTSMAALSLQVYYRYLPIYEVAEAHEDRDGINWR